MWDVEVAMKGEGRFRRDEVLEMEQGGDSRSFLPPLSFQRGRGWWGRTVLWAVFIVVLIECAFIVRLDILNTSSSSSSSYSEFVDNKLPDAILVKPNTTTTAVRKPTPRKGDGFVPDAMCSEGWLENADRVKYSRDFKTEPVLVVSGETEVFTLSFCDWFVSGAF